MSRPVISSNNITFGSSKNTGAGHAGQSDAMHIVLLGDFTARANNDRLDSANIGKRRLIEIDRDNFEEVFSSLDIHLDLPVAESPLAFHEFDDLHPDFLYGKLPLFDELRSLERRLGNPKHFASAAGEIRSWQGYHVDPPTPDLATETGADHVQPGHLLDSVLSARDTVDYGKSDVDSIDRLIKDIVAPFVSEKPDPEQRDLLDAVSMAGCELMRKICHASAFQQLEASWRSVYLLIRRIETDSKLKLFLVDIAKEEILEDAQLHQDRFEESGLYQLLVENLAVAGGTRPSLINADYYISADSESVPLISALGTIAEESGATLVCGGDTALAGCADVSETPDPADWSVNWDEEFKRQWDLLRKQSKFRSVALAAPRFLLRLPYGKKTSPIESFDYSELPQNGMHPYYLWGNSAYLLTLLLAQSYSAHGWSFRPGQNQLLEDFPLHVYTQDDGETAIKPCAEAMLTDSACQQFVAAGLLPIRSVKDRADIMIPVANALAEGFTLAGAWLD